MKFIFLILFCPFLSAIAAQPNVLLIMADDLRDFGGAYTKDVVKTPNLDRLRAHGTSFERAYVQYPVCNPSRSSMMTGLRAEQTGIVGNDIKLRDKMPNVVTLPQLCKEAGWQSHAFGKLYHLGGGKNPQAKQAWMDAGKSWHTSQAFEATKIGKKMLEGRNVTDGALSWCQWGAADGGDDDQPDGQIAAATVAKINELGDTPWFIGCGFMKPHDPFIAPKKYFDLYPLDSLKPWQDPANMTPARKESVGFGAYGTAFAKLTGQDWRDLFRAYCAGTTFMDAQLGRVLDVLDQKQLWDKTIVIFVGDHGYHTGERQWWNKNTLFERACRAPFIIAAPGMKGGQASRSLVEFVDLYPTVTDLCGLKMPHAGAGLSLRPVLENSTVSVKDAAFTLITRSPKLHGQSIRTARWRFNQWSDGHRELYDLDADPEELQDVSSSQPDTLKDLAAKLKALPAFQQ
ncbi:MAG: sulfatase [Verrucomicrobia bacterium]|nr:sulfatase [Verrucomicrobiota bacterium]